MRLLDHRQDDRVFENLHMQERAMKYNNRKQIQYQWIELT